MKVPKGKYGPLCVSLLTSSSSSSLTTSSDCDSLSNDCSCEDESAEFDWMAVDDMVLMQWVPATCTWGLIKIHIIDDK